jgi:hypothetical protein
MRGIPQAIEITLCSLHVPNVECETPRFARDDTQRDQITIAQDQLGTGTKDKSSRAMSISRRLRQFV